MAGLIEINPGLDTTALARVFKRKGWVQVRDVLTPDSANQVLGLLARNTRWGLAWQAGANGPHFVSAEQIAAMDQSAQAAILSSLKEARRASASYSFAYSSHPLEGPTHSLLLEGLNGTPFLDLVRAVTGHGKTSRVDGQATLYAPGHYLAAHTDDEYEQGRRFAYVLSMTLGEWRPEWGGYLNLLNDDGDIEAGIRPRFNSLNLFLVPRWHNVSQVLPDAPIGRFAVTGWGHNL